MKNIYIPFNPSTYQDVLKDVITFYFDQAYKGIPEHKEIIRAWHRLHLDNFNFNLPYYYGIITELNTGVVYDIVDNVPRMSFVSMVDGAERAPCTDLRNLQLSRFSFHYRRKQIEIAQVISGINIMSINPEIIEDRDTHKIFGRVFYDACVLTSYSDENMRKESLKKSSFYGSLKIWEGG